VTDNQGRATDDPAVLFAEPPGAILPLGELDLGHKGFALGLLVEALTASLGGFGRSDQPGRWGASVFLQMMDPEAFGGRESFKREAGWLAQACRAAQALPGASGVRLPGQAGLAKRRDYLKNGVELAPTIMPALKPWVDKWGVATPQPI
jgi:L-lactate dehydrogenase